MSQTTIRTIVTTDNTQLFDITKTVSANTRQSFNQPGGVATGVTALQIQGVAFPLDDLLAVDIYTDQPITLYTNSPTGSGGQVIPMAAGDIISWSAGGAIANPFTIAVTSLYLTNASGFTANPKICFDVDSD